MVAGTAKHAHCPTFCGLAFLRIEWIYCVPKLPITCNYSKVSTFPGQVSTLKVYLFTLVMTPHFPFFLQSNTIVSQQSLWSSTTVSLQLSPSHITNKQTMQEQFTEKVAFTQQCPLERYESSDAPIITKAPMIQCHWQITWSHAWHEHGINISVVWGSWLGIYRSAHTNMLCNSPQASGQAKGALLPIRESFGRPPNKGKASLQPIVCSIEVLRFHTQKGLTIFWSGLRGKLCFKLSKYCQCWFLDLVAKKHLKC